MSCRGKRLPWENPCILAARRKAIRQPILRKNDFNLLLSEYQRHYQHPNPRSVSSTPSWVPVYQAQLKRKAERENGGGGWAAGGGDGHSSTVAKTTGSQDLPEENYQQYSKCRRSCYAGLYQPYNEEATAVTTEGPDTAAAGYGSSSILESVGSSPWSSDPTGSDPTLQSRAKNQKKRERSDSGLTNLSIALCLWKKNEPTCLRPFSLLPWQQQAAQTTLEARAYAGHNVSRRIY